MKTDSFPKFLRSEEYKNLVMRELAGESFLSASPDVDDESKRKVREIGL